MSDEIVKMLDTEIAGLDACIAEAEEAIKAIDEMKRRRLRLVSSRGALMPPTAPTPRVKVEPSSGVIGWTFRFLSPTAGVTFASIAKHVLEHSESPTTKAEITAALRRLEKAGKVTREGSGKSTRYLAVAAES